MKHGIFVCSILAFHSMCSVTAPASQENLVTQEKRAWLDQLQGELENSYKPNVTLNRQGDGYYGIWYQCGKTPGEYVYKYSGGLGTYCAKHRPFAIYCREVNKTFFCYGGAKPDNQQALIHMVSYYDHTTGMVPRPTILLDKETSDAHDNPVISVDDKGFIWIFSTAHGTGRPSYIHKSKKPYSVDAFELVSANIRRFPGEDPIAFLNFSYFQVWNVPQQGFACFMTLYNQPSGRNTYFVSTPDGVNWNTPVCLGAMGRGSYQISFADETKAATAFNYHPPKEGINFRTNVYYIESRDFGKTWRNAAGEVLDLPLVRPQNNALVYDAESVKKSVYIKDLVFDPDGRPVILALETGGWECGPENGPRTWMTIRWDGKQWHLNKAFTSDNNYDTGSILIEQNTWRIIAPTVVGPQAYNPGGEMIIWESVNKGQTWNRVKQLTANSPRNHTYARSVLHADPQFQAIWADGDGRQESISNLYFCDRDGNVYMLPRQMDSEFARPVKVEPGSIR